MRVIYNDLLDVGRRRSIFPATAVDKPTLYREADVLSLHVDMRPGNENLVGREQLATDEADGDSDQHQPRRGAGRGGAGGGDPRRSRSPARRSTCSTRAAGADFPLLGLDNVLLTPHLAARTYTAIENMSWVVRDVVDVLEGRVPKYPAP